MVKVFIVYMTEQSEASGRVQGVQGERDKSRLNMVSRLDSAMREAGAGQRDREREEVRQRRRK